MRVSGNSSIKHHVAHTVCTWPVCSRGANVKQCEYVVTLPHLSSKSQVNARLSFMSNTDIACVVTQLCGRSASCPTTKMPNEGEVPRSANNLSHSFHSQMPPAPHIIFSSLPSPKLPFCQSLLPKLVSFPLFFLRTEFWGRGDAPLSLCQLNHSRHVKPGERPKHGYGLTFQCLGNWVRRCLLSNQQEDCPLLADLTFHVLFGNMSFTGFIFVWSTVCLLQQVSVYGRDKFRSTLGLETQE